MEIFGFSGLIQQRLGIRVFRCLGDVSGAFGEFGWGSVGDYHCSTSWITMPPQSA
jgi:hypothetical protein